MLYKERLALTRGVLIFWGILFAFGVLTVVSSYGAHWRLELAYGVADSYRVMGWAIAILAVIFGTSLPSECGEHARYALVRPISRIAYALGVFGCGAVALGIAYVLSGVVAYLPIGIVTGFRYVNVTSSAPMVPFYVGYVHALAWYGLVAAFGSLTRRAWPAAMGLTVGAIVMYVLGQSPTPLGYAARLLDVFNPMDYYVAAIAVAESQGKYYGAFAHLPIYVDALVLFATAAIWIAVSALRWRTLQVS